MKQLNQDRTLNHWKKKPRNLGAILITWGGLAFYGLKLDQYEAIGRKIWPDNKGSNQIHMMAFFFIPFFFIMLVGDIVAGNKWSISHAFNIAMFIAAITFCIAF